jgi:hypothetical protein
MALVELVEDHQADAVKRRIALKTARQHSFGHDLDPCARAHATVAAGAVADQPAHRFAEQLGGAGCRGARRDATGLEHHDELTAEPRRGQKRRRDEGRLTGAGRRLKHGAGVRRQRVDDRREHRLDGEASHGAVLLRTVGAASAAVRASSSRECSGSRALAATSGSCRRTTPR